MVDPDQGLLSHYKYQILTEMVSFHNCGCLLGHQGNMAQNLVLFQVADAVASEEISPQVKNVIYYPSNGGRDGRDHP